MHLSSILSRKAISKIFMENEVLQPSPKDGLIIKFKGSKYALVYNESSKNFDEFYQYTQNDIIQDREERERAETTMKHKLNQKKK